MNDKPLYYKYWGKARKKEVGPGYEGHLGAELGWSVDIIKWKEVS
jgi:hypothetical protein